MSTCDKCGSRAKGVTIGDGCPECGQLVGWPVPDGNSSAVAISDYDVEATDEQLEDAVRDVALRNFNTLLRRKRQAEAAAGYKKPEVDDADSEAGEPVQDQERSGDEPDQGGGQEAAAGGQGESVQPTEGDAPQP
jgi:hypothetical protein